MTIKFPAVNISIENWDKDEDYLVYLLEDEFIYTPNKVFFDKYFLNHAFTDSNGEIFEITDRRLPGRIRQIFSFIPMVCKVELVFTQTGRKMSIDQIRHHVLKQLYILDESDNKTQWIDQVKRAKSYEDIIMGENTD